MQGDSLRGRAEGIELATGQPAPCPVITLPLCLAGWCVGAGKQVSVFLSSLLSISEKLFVCELPFVCVCLCVFVLFLSVCVCA